MRDLDAIEDDIIRLAYAVAVDPSRYMDLTDAIIEHQALSYNDHDERNHFGDREAGSLIAKREDTLRRHLSNAIRLLQDHCGTIVNDQSLESLISMNRQPTFLIDENLHVQFTNESGITLLGIKKGKRLRKGNFEDDGLNVLKGLFQPRDEKNSLFSIVKIVRFLISDEVPPIRLALTLETNEFSQTLVEATTIDVVWDDVIGEKFKTSFGLTHAEYLILRGIILGYSTPDIARNRNRSVATIRNQLKKLNQKLGIHSQVELVSLYSGFARLSFSKNLGRVEFYASPASTVSIESSQDIQFWTPPQSKRETAYKVRQYEIRSFGPEDGYPVLNFPGLLLCGQLTTEMKTAISRHNVRFITIMRPGFGMSTYTEKAENLPPIWEFPEHFAKDMQALLDRLNIEGCTIVGQLSGSIYAYACARLMQKRIHHIVTFAGVLPYSSPASLETMRPWQKAGVRLMISNPRFFEFMVENAVRFLITGRQDKFLERHFRHSPSDLRLLKKTENRKILHNAAADILKEGGQTMFREFQLIMNDWSRYLPPDTVPVTWFQGVEDSSFAAQTVEKFCANLPHITLISLLKTGQLIQLTHAEEILSAVASFKRK